MATGRARVVERKRPGEGEAGANRPAAPWQCVPRTSWSAGAAKGARVGDVASGDRCGVALVADGGECVNLGADVAVAVDQRVLVVLW